MSKPYVDISIEGVEDVYRGGERLYGTVRLEAEQPLQVESLEVAAGLLFEGPPYPERSLRRHFDARIEPICHTEFEVAPGEPVEVDFDFELPTGPYNVSADHFSVEWVVSARAELSEKGRDEIRTARTFHLRPNADAPYGPAQNREMSAREQSLEPISWGKELAKAIVVLGGALTAFFWSSIHLGSHLLAGMTSPGFVIPFAVTAASAATVAVAFVQYSALSKHLWRRFATYLDPDYEYGVAGIDAPDMPLEPGETRSLQLWFVSSVHTPVERMVFKLACRERYPDPGTTYLPRTETETIYEQRWVHRIRPVRELEPDTEFTRDFELQLPDDAPCTVEALHSEEPWSVEWVLSVDLRKSKYPPEPLTVLEHPLLVDRTGRET